MTYNEIFYDYNVMWLTYILKLFINDKKGKVHALSCIFQSHRHICKLKYSSKPLFCSSQLLYTIYFPV